MVTSRQLEYFTAVASELHFTRAAERLRIAQPALSQHIRNLERQLGLTLFERTKRRVALTPAGAALLEHGERILADIAAVEDEMRDWAGGIRGRVRVGTARAVAVPLARILGAYGAAHPAVDVELREETTQEMLDDLQAGRLDVATLAAPPPPDAGLATHPFPAQPLVLVTGDAGPFAADERIPVSALDGVDLATYGPGSAVGAIIGAALSAAGAEARMRFQTREYSTARVLASAGLAVAIIPRSIAEEPGHPIRIVRLDPEPTLNASIAWSARRRPTPALASFIEIATAELGNG